MYTLKGLGDTGPFTAKSLSQTRLLSGRTKHRGWWHMRLTDMALSKTWLRCYQKASSIWLSRVRAELGTAHLVCQLGQFVLQDVPLLLQG